MVIIIFIDEFFFGFSGFVIVWFFDRGEYLWWKVIDGREVVGYWVVFVMKKMCLCICMYMFKIEICY